MKLLTLQQPGKRSRSNRSVSVSDFCGLNIIRDDMLVGGTKSRAAEEYLSSCDEDTVIYASPPCGMAQVAIANASRKLNKSFLLFTSKVEGEMTKYTEQALELGASVQFCYDLDDSDFNSRRFNGFRIPLGLDCPVYRQTLEHALREALCEIEFSPSQVVHVPLGSGTLATTLRKVLPPYVHMSALSVNILPRNDYRIKAVSQLHNTTVALSGYEFEEECLLPIDFPSNKNYDAKVIEYALSFGRQGDYVWNVAG